MQGFVTSRVLLLDAIRISTTPLDINMPHMLPTNQAPPTRESLVLRLRDPDDLQAWSEFVEIYRPVILSLAAKRGLQTADAEDLAQEVLTRVARCIDRWDPNPEKGSFRAWLATITRNLVSQFFREGGRRPSTGMDSKIVGLIDGSTQDAFHDQEFDLERERQLFAWAARKVQSRFEEKTWHAFWITAVQGLSTNEASETLGITKSQIYVARSRVMSLLKQTIEQSDFDPITDKEGG